MNEVILMAHVLFGVACLLAAVWLFVDVLHASEANLVRIRRVSWAAAIFMWMAFVIAGYWYVVSYHVDKAIILGGPWPFAHNFFMETKEHLVIMLLLLTTYLPIAARNNLAASSDARRLMLWLTAGIVLLALLERKCNGQPKMTDVESSHGKERVAKFHRERGLRRIGSGSG